jgi:hypothetical protein
VIEATRKKIKDMDEEDDDEEGDQEAEEMQVKQEEDLHIKQEEGLDTKKEASEIKQEMVDDEEDDDEEDIDKKYGLDTYDEGIKLVSVCRIVASIKRSDISGTCMKSFIILYLLPCYY